MQNESAIANTLARAAPTDIGMRKSPALTTSGSKLGGELHLPSALRRVRHGVRVQ